MALVSVSFSSQTPNACFWARRADHSTTIKANFVQYNKQNVCVLYKNRKKTVEHVDIYSKVLPNICGLRKAVEQIF